MQTSKENMSRLLIKLSQVRFFFFLSVVRGNLKVKKYKTTPCIMCERFLFASNDTIKSNGRGRVLKLSINYLIGLKAKWVSKVYRGITQTTKKKNHMPVYYKCININYRIFPVYTLTNKRVCYCHASEMLVHGNCMYTFLQDIKRYDISVYQI